MHIFSTKIVEDQIVCISILEHIESKLILDSGATSRPLIPKKYALKPKLNQINLIPN